MMDWVSAWVFTWDIFWRSGIIKPIIGMAACLSFLFVYISTHYDGGGDDGKARK